VIIDRQFRCFYVYSKQDLAVSAPFYHAPMASGAVYVYSGKQVHIHVLLLHVLRDASAASAMLLAAAPVHPALFYSALTRDINIAILSVCLSVTFRYWMKTA